MSGGRMTAEQTPDIEALAAAFDPHQRKVMTGACICGKWPPPNHDISWSEHLAAALAPVLDAAVREARAAELREAADWLPNATEGPLRVGTALWPECDRDAYSLAVDESQSALRDRADRIDVDAPEGGADRTGYQCFPYSSDGHNCRLTEGHDGPHVCCDGHEWSEGGEGR